MIEYFKPLLRNLLQSDVSLTSDGNVFFNVFTIRKSFIYCKTSKSQFSMLININKIKSFNFQVGWRITVEWQAGNLACKVFLFARAFCLYLSSNVLVCVSLDRCFAVIYPLRVSAARRRGKLMLSCAWCIALVYAFPQVSIFKLCLIK